MFILTKKQQTIVQFASINFARAAKPKAWCFLVFIVVSLTQIHPANAQTSSSPEKRLLRLENKIRSIKQKRFPIRLKAGELPSPSASLEETHLALASLQLEKAKDHLSRTTASPTLINQYLDQANKLLASTKPEKQPAFIEIKKQQELAYFTNNDGSPQPYYVYVPDSVKSTQNAPLVLFLHGYVAGTSRTRPYLAPSHALSMADKFGFILATPHGRTNTDFQYVGERDVLRVRAEMLAFFSIDPDRVYLIGVSMGGAGAWQLGTHYPDLFAGIAPINAQADWFAFWEDNFNRPPKNQMPPHIQWLISMNNPSDLGINLSTLYSYSQSASQGFLGTKHTARMIETFKKHNIAHDTYINHSPMGHYTYWQRDTWKRPVKELLKHKRKTAPKSLRFKTYTTRYPGPHWVRIETIDHWGEPATFSADYNEKTHTIELATENIKRITIAPPVPWLKRQAELSLMINGRTHPAFNSEKRSRQSIDIMPSGAGATDSKPHYQKTSTVCGPMPDAMNFPFLVVRGTRGNPTEKEANNKLTKQFVKDWDTYAEGKPRVIKDTALTPEIIANYNLILIGYPHTNAFTNSISEKLPFTFKNNSIILPDERQFSQEKHGFILTYPNPKNPKRYAVIYAGFTWGRQRSSNHRFDRIPDWIIYNKEKIDALEINAYEAAGFFTSNWKYSPDLTDTLPETGLPLKSVPRQ